MDRTGLQLISRCQQQRTGDGDPESRQECPHAVRPPIRRWWPVCSETLKEGEGGLVNRLREGVDCW